MDWKVCLVVSLIAHFGFGAIAARKIGIKEGDEIDWLFVWGWEPVILLVFLIDFRLRFQRRRLKRSLRRLRRDPEKELDRLADRLIRRRMKRFQEKRSIAQQLLDQTGFGIGRIKYGKDE